MKNKLTADQSRLVCMEATSRSGSLPPPYGWCKRFTLLKGGALYLYEVHGYLPDISKWTEFKGLRELEDKVNFTDGRFYFTDDVDCCYVSFSWLDTSDYIGYGRLIKVKLSVCEVQGLLNDVCINGGESFPEKSDVDNFSVGGGSSHLTFSCLRGSKLVTRELSSYDYEQNPEKTKFNELERLIKYKLKSAISKSLNENISSVESFGVEKNLPENEVVNRYKIRGFLGCFSESLIYTAYDMVENKLVNLCEYYPQGVSLERTRGNRINLQDKSNIESYMKGLSDFKVKAHMYSNLPKHNLSFVFGMFESNNTAYMVMNYHEDLQVYSFD